MSRSVANALMLLVALIWGTTFVAQQLGMAHVGPLTYTGVRFLLGALFVLPLALREYGRLQARGARLDRADWLAWCGLGVLLFLGAVFQQIGIMGTTVSNAGFLTALYVPLVPILAWLVDRQAPHVSVWPASIGSFIGTFMLSGGRFDTLTVGDYWVIASTFFWAAHVLWVGRVAARKGVPVMVAVAQFIVCGLLSMLVALFTEEIAMDGIVAAMPAILYGGLLSVGIAYTLQVVAQRHAPATDAAILLSSEILFAAMAGALYLGERLSFVQLMGGVVIFVCILAVQLAPMFSRKTAAAV
ncbi:DMT family transporter [uncultured Dechloromonas sp.]|uniref:DMT family transporter n=1 Tax=uncultured Dechloromonas sp. TaxID=171719 RepID=UPI0025FF42D4|nr:DMT family transporter [uncultured Dechloromonas sp.]